MNRPLQWFNLAGVLALALLAVIQWQANRHVNLQLINAEAAELRQSRGLAEKDQTIQGNIEDMNEFRARVAKAATELEEQCSAVKAAEDKLAGVEAERARLAASVEGLKAALEQWKAAVAARDTELKQADARAAGLVTDRNEAVGRFNDLATKYNAAQDQLKQAAEEVKKLAAERDETAAKFNELAAKYNALVQRVNEAATRP